MSDGIDPAMATFAARAAQCHVGLARRLARTEGILAGHSSGAALWGAAQVTRDLDHAVAVMIFPDGGDRYLSGGLYVSRL